MRRAIANRAFKILYVASGFIIRVKTDNTGTSGNTQFTLPTTGTNYTIRTLEHNLTGLSGNTTITFSGAGSYDVEVKEGVSGGFGRILFNNGGDRLKVVEVKQVGNIVWNSFSNAFYGCSNMVWSATDSGNTVGASSMYFAFRGCTLFNGLLDFNTANVTDMSLMFFGASNFNQPVNFDTSLVNNMLAMFDSATNFNQSVANFDTALVTNMQQMFRFASNFNQSVANFNTANVTKMSFMFLDASNFNQSVANFNTAKVTTMSQMFNGASAFNQSVNNFNTSLVTDMFLMFNGATNFNQPITTWDIHNVSNFTNFMLGVTLSTVNYDATLVAFEANLQVHYPGGAGYPHTISTHFGGSKFTIGGAGEIAKDSLVANFGWTIADGGGI